MLRGSVVHEDAGVTDISPWKSAQKCSSYRPTPNEGLKTPLPMMRPVVGSTDIDAFCRELERIGEVGQYQRTVPDVRERRPGDIEGRTGVLDPPGKVKR